MNPALDIATWLQAQAFGSMTTDGATWLIRYSQRVESEQPMLTVFATGGPLPLGAHDGDTHRSPVVQIMVSGSKKNGITKYDAVVTQAEAIFNAADKQVIGDTQTYLAFPRVPIALGYDADGRPEVSLNIRLEQK